MFERKYQKERNNYILFLGYHWIERKRRITSLLSKLQIRYINISPPLVVREVLGPVLGLNRVMTKDVKSWDVVGLVAYWVSSNFHSSFSPISSPCGGL